ncbi:LacI family transcriptional regulator [Babesia caballi]|uniref:LacI family transcriptional regulator n=1 Tax=Babesia caballi TaxID=5871 RepID=A0AAV4LXF9_BABCB|nr:LacI family transcriptional regulator [Babesia caballi]
MLDLAELQRQLLNLGLVVVRVVRRPDPNLVAADIRPEFAQRLGFQDIVVRHNLERLLLPEQKPDLSRGFVLQELRFAEAPLLPDLLAIRVRSEAIKLGALLPEDLFVLLSGDNLDLLHFHLRAC